LVELKKGSMVQRIGHMRLQGSGFRVQRIEAEEGSAYRETKPMALARPFRLRTDFCRILMIGSAPDFLNPEP
jgi:hypothetical protein